MSTDLISAQYLACLQNSEPCNYTRIPNILDDLTYNELDEVTGETKIKRISIYAKELYRVLKKIAGQENICWRNSEKLAEIANMSVGQVVKCKKELQQKFNELDGSPLIEIHEKKKATIKNGEKLNGTTYHQILILDIWGLSRAYYFMKKTLREAGSPHEPVGGAGSPHEPALEGARSLSERIKTDCSKTPLFNEQDSTANADSVCLKDKSNFVKDEKSYIFNWLMKHGCNTIKAVEIATTYASDELKKSIEYTEFAVEKNRKKMKSLGNPMAYLIKTLENRWWMSKNA